MDKIFHLTLLFDFYSELLTDRQKVFFESYYHNNFSLKEIAKEFDITPQGVRDIIKRTEKSLIYYESKLFLLKTYNYKRSELEDVLALIDNIIEENKDSSLNFNFFSIKEKIKKLID